MDELAKLIVFIIKSLAWIWVGGLFLACFVAFVLPSLIKGFAG